jgi:hypothetical protein
VGKSAKEIRREIRERMKGREKIINKTLCNMNSE